ALTQVGITNIVVNPASIAVAANDKVKTDRRDSKRLAIDLPDGRLRGIYIPTEAEELGFCRKVGFWRPNPKIGYQKINDLRVLTFLFSVICDRALLRAGA